MVRSLRSSPCAGALRTRTSKAIDKRPDNSAWVTLLRGVPDRRADAECWRVRSSKTCHRTVDCRIRVVASRSDSYRGSAVESDCQAARGALATTFMLRASHNDAGVSDLVGAHELRKRSEKTVFRVRASLRGDRVLCQYLNAHQ